MPRALDACVIDPLRYLAPGIDRPDVRPVIQMLVCCHWLRPPRPFVVWRDSGGPWRVEKWVTTASVNADIEIDSAWDNWPHARRRQAMLNRDTRNIRRWIDFAEKQAHLEKPAIEQELTKRKESPCSSANATAS